MKKSITPEQESVIIEKYLNGLTCKQIAVEYKCSWSTICNYLKKNNIPLRDVHLRNKKWSFDENYLENIDCHQKAWLLGLFYSDGSNDEERNVAKITLHKQDEECLLKVKNLLNYDGNLKPRSGCNDIVLISPKFSQDLKRHGCYQNKSLTITIPDSIFNSPFINSFLLGILDGDGHVRLRTRAKRGTSFICEIACGNQIFLEQIKNLIDKNIGLGSSIDTIGRKIRIGQTKEKVLKFLDWIYSSDIQSMERKRQIYLQMKNSV